MMIRRRLILFLCATLVFAGACDSPESEDGASEEDEQVEEVSDEAEGDAAEEDEEGLELTGADKGVELAMEPVTRITVEEFDEAFQYIFERDGETLGKMVGDSRYFVGHESFDDVEVRGVTIDEEEVGHSEIISTEEEEQLVLRWDEDAFDDPMFGILTSSEKHSGASTSSLNEMPRIIARDLDEIDMIVIGEAMEEGGSSISAPFEFESERFSDDYEFIVHGPYVKVSLP